jgi:hypothetical protein
MKDVILEHFIGGQKCIITMQLVQHTLNQEVVLIIVIAQVVRKMEAVQADTKNIFKKSLLALFYCPYYF